MNEYLQTELPPEIFNMGDGSITQFNGRAVKVHNTGRGTRQLEDLGSWGAYQANQIVQNAVNEYKQKIDQYNSKYSEFEKNNPFVFDTVLAEEKTKAKQRLDPYYEQTLSDYLKGVNTKRQRGLEDERTLLTQLNADTDKFVGDQKIQFQDAVDRTRQGYADAGLYDSGANMRSQGRLEADNNATVSNYMTNAERKTNQIKLNTTRSMEDLALDEATKRRDLTTDEAYQVQSQALPEVQRRQSQREFERGQYTGAPPGVDPLQYQNSLYSLLR